MNEVISLKIPGSAPAVIVSDATGVAQLLSCACPDRAYAYAMMMQERTAWDINGDWHEQWLTVTTLLRSQIRRSG